MSHTPAPLPRCEAPWTVAEAAAWLKVSPEHVRRLARACKLPGVKLMGGREWRFDPAVVRALVPMAPPPIARTDVAELVEARMDAAFPRKTRQA